MTTTRREFLKSASLGTGVAVLSMYVPGMGGKEAQAAAQCTRLTCGSTSLMTTPSR